MFDYMGRMITEGDNYWPSVAGNLQKARKSWGRISPILSREEADMKVSGHFFKATFQAVLLSGAETWVLIPLDKQALIIFQNMAA